MVKKINEEKRIKDRVFDNPEYDDIFDFSTPGDPYDSQTDSDMIYDKLESLNYHLRDIRTSKKNLIDNIISNGSEDVLQKLYDLLDDTEHMLGNIKVFLLNNGR